MKEVKLKTLKNESIGIHELKLDGDAAWKIACKFTLDNELIIYIRGFDLGFDGTRYVFSVTSSNIEVIGTVLGNTYKPDCDFYVSSTEAGAEYRKEYQSTVNKTQFKTRYFGQIPKYRFVQNPVFNAHDVDSYYFLPTFFLGNGNKFLIMNEEIGYKKCIDLTIIADFVLSVVLPTEDVAILLTKESIYFFDLD